jgi:hypothetical protein
MVVIIGAVPETPRHGRNEPLIAPEQAGDDHGDEEEDIRVPPGPAGRHGHRGDAHEVQDGDPHEGPGHEDAEVGEVDQLDDAVHHGEAKREQGVHHAEREPVDDLLEDDVQPAHARMLMPAPSDGTLPGPARRQRRPGIRISTPTYPAPRLRS